MIFAVRGAREEAGTVGDETKSRRYQWFTYVRDIDTPTCIHTGMYFFFLSSRSKGGSRHRRRRRTKVEAVAATKVVTYARNLIHIPAYSTCIYTAKQDLRRQRSRQDLRRQRSRGNSGCEVVTHERCIYTPIHTLI